MPENTEVISTPEEEAEFDAAFAEHAEESDLTAGVTPGEGGGRNAEELDDEQEFTDAFEDAATDPAAQEEEPEIDLAAQLAEQQAEIDRLKQSERSQRGRVSALTKKLVEQRAAEQQPPAAQQGGEPGADEEGDDWEEFQREFPEMAAIVDKRLSKVTSKVDEVSQKVGRVTDTTNTLVDKEIDSYKQEQIDAVLDRHKDISKVMKSQEFSQWRANAPEDVRAQIESHHAEDAIKALDRFKEETGWNSAQGQESDKSEPSRKSEVELINERRAAKLRKSAGISSKKVGRTASQKTESSDDFDAAFDAAASEKEKNLSLRY